MPKIKKAISKRKKKEQTENPVKIFSSSSKSLFAFILTGIIVGGLFSATLYAFATYGVDEYFPLGNTLNPTCVPGDPYCKVITPAYFSFGSNNFTGTGNFTTTGTGTFGTLKVGSVYTFPTSDGTNGQVLTTSGSGVISWSTINALPTQTGNSGKYLTTDGSSASWASIDVTGYIPYTGATGTVNLGIQALSTTGAIGGGAITATSFVIGANTISSFVNLDSLADLSWSSGSPLIKMTATGTFQLDSTAYYKSGDTATFANITDSGLTITRIPYASTAGLLTDSANLTFNGNTLEVTSTSAAQEKLTYDALNYATLTTGATGDLTFTTATGTTGGDIILNPASSASNSMLSASGILILGGYEGTYNEDLQFNFETTENTVGLSSTTGVTSVNFGSLNIVSAGTLTLGGSTAGTLVTRVKAGAPDEADANGSVVIDSSNARIYFRYGGAWHYAAQTAGFQIPDFESIDPISGEQIAEGDIVLGMINQTMSDNALHGVWVKWDSVKAELLAEARGELSTSGTWGEGSITGVKTETLLNKVTNVLFSLGISVKNGITTIEQLASKKIKTDVVEIQQMQMTDKATGDAYCTWIENGEWVKAKGECSSVEVAIAAVEQIQENQEANNQVVNDVVEEAVDQITEQATEQIQEQVQEEVQQQVEEQIQDQIKEEVADQIKQQNQEQTDQEKKDKEEKENKEKEEEKKEEEPPAEELAPIEEPVIEETVIEETIPVEEPAPVEELVPIETPPVEESPTIGEIVQESAANLLGSSFKFLKEKIDMWIEKISMLHLIEKSSAGLFNSFQYISDAFQDLWTKIEKVLHR